MNEDGIQTRETLELRDYLRVIRDRFWIIPTTVFIVLAVALLVSLLSTPQYKASARLVYSKNNLEQALFGAQVFPSGLTQQDRDVQTGAMLVKLDPVAVAVQEDLGTSESTGALLAMVKTESKTGTNVVDITAVSDNPQEAADVANGFARQFVLFRQKVDRQTVEAARVLVDEELKSLSAVERESEYGLGLKQKYDNLRIIEAMQDGGFTVVQTAAVPTTPFSPQTVRDAIVAVVLGLVAGIGLAFLLDYMDRGVKDEKTVETALGAPVLARVPLLARRRGDKKNIGARPEAIGFNRSPVLLESYRTLRSNLEFFSIEKQQSVFLITSSEPQEGKSTTAINLGLSLALAGKRVVVVDADLRKPVIHEYVGVSQSPGLSNLLAGASRFADCLQLVKADEFLPPAGRRGATRQKQGLMQRNIYVMTAGPVPPNPAELLTSSRMTKLVSDLSAMCDYVLIDAPPVLAVSDAVTLARHADGVVVVVRLGTTSRDQVFEVRQVFERANVRVLGAVAVGTKKSGSRRYGYSYGYGHQPGPEVDAPLPPLPSS